MAGVSPTSTNRPSLELKLPAVLPLYKKPYNTAVVNMTASMPPNKERRNALQEMQLSRESHSPIEEPPIV
jgi:hypothetical protein